MMTDLRRLVLLALLLFLPVRHGMSSEPVTDRAALVTRIDRGLELAGKYLLDKQSADGAWRSETYGNLRDGPALTPYVLSGLFFLPQAGPEARAAYTRGVAYLGSFVGEDGTLRVGPRELGYPVYTAASASRAVALLEPSVRNRQVQQAWLTYLRGRQLIEPLGWTREDPEYGGWGFSLAPPRKPKPGAPREPLCESNLSATLFALAALTSARVPRDDPALAQALVFVERCQNYGDDPAQADPRFDDGGFFFLPGDAGQNKAGTAGTDRFGRERFRSYGTMTADGLRALVRCGLEPTHPRVLAARHWLECEFSAQCNPGHFPGERAVLQGATYYYWVWAVAHAMLALQPHSGDPPETFAHWTHALSEELLRRQRADGSWANRFTDAKEDDPLVATPWAAAALAIGRYLLTGERQDLDEPRPAS